MLDLEYAGRKVRVHYEKAVGSWRTTIHHAWWCGKYLRKVKVELQHGRWLPWLKANFPGHRKTASNWMRLAKIKREALEENANTTVRDALESIGTGGSKGLPKNKRSPDDLVRAELLKLLLKDAWKDWTQEEINWLERDLEFESKDSMELERLFGGAMNSLRRAIQRRIRLQELEVARRNRPVLKLVVWPPYRKQKRRYLTRQNTQPSPLPSSRQR